MNNMHTELTANTNPNDEEVMRRMGIVETTTMLHSSLTALGKYEDINLELITLNKLTEKLQKKLLAHVRAELVLKGKESEAHAVPGMDGQPVNYRNQGVKFQR